MNIYIGIGVLILFITIGYILVRWYCCRERYETDDHYNENMPEEARG